MKLKTRVPLVMMSLSSWYLIHGLILPVAKNPKMHVETLTMASTDIGFKNAIKLFSQLANMSKITNMSIKCANNAGITIIDFEKVGEPYEL